MITVKLLYICLTLSAILYPEMVSTVSAQDLFLEKEDKDCRTPRVKREGFLETPCVTPEKEMGKCMNIKQCPSLLNMLISQGEAAHKYIRQRTCTFDGTNAIVCCLNDTKDNKVLNNNQDPLLRSPHCGHSASIHDTVVGGVRAKLGAWPWIAALGYRNTSNSSQLQWQCGGTLISARHILTAAHCANNDYLSAVRIGDLNLRRSDDGAHPVQVKVAQKIIHPQYTAGSVENDIAVLELADDVPFTESLHPICLPIDPPFRNWSFDNYYSYTAGWGSQSPDGQTVDDLMEVEVPVISHDLCKRQYSDIKGAVIDDRVICAGYYDAGKDACQGDIGGPLMLSDRIFYYYQIGVISHGYECAVPGYAGVYTRVTEFLDFIVSAMQ